MLSETETVWPGLWAAITLESALVVAVAFPSTAVITSPLWIPAFAAALFGSTAATTTPGVPFGVVATGPSPKPNPKGLPNELLALLAAGHYSALRGRFLSDVRRRVRHGDVLRLNKYGKAGRRWR